MIISFLTLETLNGSIINTQWASRITFLAFYRVLFGISKFTFFTNSCEFWFTFLIDIENVATEFRESCSRDRHIDFGDYISLIAL